MACLQLIYGVYIACLWGVYRLSMGKIDVQAYPRLNYAKLITKASLKEVKLGPATTELIQLQQHASAKNLCQ